jgi:hypothetical protein
MKESRPEFVLRLVPSPGTDPIRALRCGLKLLLRRCGLRCVSIEEYYPANDFVIRPSTEMRHTGRRRYPAGKAINVSGTDRRNARRARARPFQ